MLSLTVQITGHSEADIEAALDEVTRSIENGNTSGFDRNETGQYSFEVTGKEVEALMQVGIDYDEQLREFSAVCPEHGVIATGGNTGQEHDDVIIAATGHEQRMHGGDGVVPVGLLILKDNYRP